MVLSIHNWEFERIESFVHAQIKENIKASRHWLLCGEFTGELRIPRTKAQ